MRLSVVEMSEGETFFYNLGVFKEHEDLIVFPMHEFKNFYEEMEHKKMHQKYRRNGCQIREDPASTIRISNRISNY